MVSLTEVNTDGIRETMMLTAVYESTYNQYKTSYISACMSGLASKDTLIFLHES